LRSAGIRGPRFNFVFPKERSKLESPVALSPKKSVRMLSFTVDWQPLPMHGLPADCGRVDGRRFRREDVDALIRRA